MKKFLTYSVLLLLLFSCSKEKSKKWLVIDINMTNSTTGLAVNGSFELEYRQPKIVGEDKLVIEDLGNSEDGKF